MNLLTRKILGAAALAFCAPLLPLAAHAQTGLTVHTVAMTFDMPNMNVQKFRVTSEHALNLEAGAVTHESDAAVCSVTPARAKGVVNHVTGETYADFTVIPKAPGNCTVTVHDPNYGTIHVQVTVNMHGVYVTDGNSIKVFKAGISGNANPEPIAVLAGPNTGLDHPQGIAIDRTGKMYVANAGNSSITVYAANRTGNRGPLAIIKGANTLMQSPWGIALDSAGYIYAANTQGGVNDQGSVTIFPPDPRGLLDEAPMGIIKGTLTHLSAPRGIALDASGRIYVANYGTNAVTVYAAKAGPAPLGTLNEDPVAVISGDNTKLMQPTSIALDALGRIYVANTAMGSESIGHIEVFAANPEGGVNVAPLATITGPNTLLGLPEGIAIAQNGHVLVVNPTSVTSYTIEGKPDTAPLMTLVGSNVESPSAVAIH